MVAISAFHKRRIVGTKLEFCLRFPTITTNFEQLGEQEPQFFPSNRDYNYGYCSRDYGCDPVEQQWFLYANQVARRLASRVPRSSTGVLASLLCPFVIAPTGSTTNVASNHDSDDDLLCCHELDLSDRDRQWFTRKHDLASKPCTCLGHDRCCLVLS